MRIKSTLKNTIAAIAQRYLTSILAFVSRTVFIQVLGTTYLGVNSLFADIFMMLSLAELGVGSAITYFMYKPMANQNEQEISSLMKMYASLYQRIGIFVGLVGLLLIPFLDAIVNTEVAIDNLTLIYVLLLVNLVVTYFFSYKRSIFIADQKDYVNSINELTFNTLRIVLQIIFLLLTKNFIVYLSISILSNLAANIHISLKANKAYPYLSNKQTEVISKEKRRYIFSRIKAIFSHKIGSVVVFGTDNVLLSLFENINFVGLYANYTLIINFAMAPLNQIFAAMSASVGNLSITESKEKSLVVFNHIFFLNFWLFGFSALALFFLLNPFISVWIGKEYTLSLLIVSLIVTNFYISGMRQSAGVFVQAKGLFYNTRFKPIIEAIINLMASVILGYYYGAIGIFMGTLTSLLLTSFWVDAYVLYKEWFELSVFVYFKKYILMTLVMISSGVILYVLFNNVALISSSFVLQVVAVTIIPNLIFFVVFLKSEEQIYFKELIISFLTKKNK